VHNLSSLLFSSCPPSLQVLIPSFQVQVVLRPIVSRPLSWDLYYCRTFAVLMFWGASPTRGWVVQIAVTLESKATELMPTSYCPIWDSPNLEGQVPVFICPRNRVPQLYPRALSSLYFASYDSQGYGGGILRDFPSFQAVQYFYNWNGPNRKRTFCPLLPWKCVQQDVAWQLISAQYRSGARFPHAERRGSRILGAETGCLTRMGYDAVPSVDIQPTCRRSMFLCLVWGSR
jgi:hypothetical protein